MVFLRCSLLLKVPFKRYSSSALPAYNWDYICDNNNHSKIATNIDRRKGVGNIKQVQVLYQHYKEALEKNSQNCQVIYFELLKATKKLPNDTHPEVLEYGDTPKVVRTIGKKTTFSCKPFEFDKIGKKLNLIRTEHLGNFCGNRSYYFYGPLAELEHALVRYSVQNLVKKGFTLMSVPDILPKHIIESCGMDTEGERTQIYELDSRHGDNLCLSGTSEMALAGYFMNKHIDLKDLPIKVAAVSRCYRAETSHLLEERGIYRVHQFTKVEMFAVTTSQTSDETLEEFRTIQEESFGSLGLHLQTLDMPPHELGAPAYRKYDLEAWLPGRQIYGEVSSCSNCTDYQSRRLNITYSGNENKKYVHTVNGTACAVPRMIIAIVETGQQDDGTIAIPPPLIPFMNTNTNFIRKQKIVPQLKLVK